MEPQDEQRRLTAILAAELVGYRRLMGDDEAGMLAALKAHRKEPIDLRRKVTPSRRSRRPARRLWRCLTLQRISTSCRSNRSSSSNTSMNRHSTRRANLTLAIECA